MFEVRALIGRQAGSQTAHASPKPQTAERRERDRIRPQPVSRSNGPSAARNIPQHSYHHHSSLLSSVPRRFIIRPSTINHICDRVRHSYTRSTRLSAAVRLLLAHYRQTSHLVTRCYQAPYTHPSLAQQTSGRVSTTLYLRLSLSYHVTSA